MPQIKVIIERYEEGYLAYPLGMKGVVLGAGNTYEAALSDVKSAMQLHMETFGPEALEANEIIETFVAEVRLQDRPGQVHP